MRQRIIAAIGAAFIGLSSASETLALPIGDDPLVIASEPSQSLVQDARVYCYNRYTGRFLHWGSCGRPVVRYRRVYRVYCYNRRTGRFLHWGHC